MTNEEIAATLALSPKEAAAIIMERFRHKQVFSTHIRGDAYRFLVDPTVTYPSAVLEELGQMSAAQIALFQFKEFLRAFGEDVVRNNNWGVVGYTVLGYFLILNIEPGYLERGGRIRRDVPPETIPQLLVHLKRVKELLDREAQELVVWMGRSRWWREKGFLERDVRKQDWTTRDGD